MSGSNIKVVVRCRPLNSREKARGATRLIRMEGNKTILSKPAAQGGKPTDELKAFTFDQSYWSADTEDPDYADQERVYNDLGRELLDHAFNGYNCCIFAYGQTGSGKSYSMMGYGEDKGIIPRTCVELFERIRDKRNDKLNFQVEVSYIEIYNEKVHDLLNPQNRGSLKVREHPVLGPYVQDLSRLAVNSFENIDQLMDEGNKARTVAATNMNETSSRSHAVFTIFVTQKLTDPETKQTQEKVARISLVDLAGSERANSTGATGVRLKEGANINKSLTTLGKVIAGLAEQASADPKKSSKKSKEGFVPFRDSVLTWLLKDSLGGNSKTCMIAAISPADYDETLSTLRYADQAKKIRTKAVVNEDPTAKVMRELKDEVEALRQALMVYAPEEVEKITATAHPVKGQKKQAPPAAAAAVAGAGATLTPPKTPSPSKSTVVFTDANGNTTQLTKDEMVDQLKVTEKLLTDMNQTWEEKLQNTEKIHVERENTLKKLGITIEKNEVGVYTPKEIPYMINLNEDPLMSECLMYHIKTGKTFVVRLDENTTELPSPPPEETTDEEKGVIRLSGTNIRDKHCYFENINDTVTLYPGEDCTTMVNGRRISEPKLLKSGYRIILGDNHVFRFNNPGEAMREREQQMQQADEVQRNTDSPSPPSPTSESQSLTSALGSSEVMDWNFARREAMLNTYINDSNFGNFTDEDLDKLFDDVSKVRVLRKRQSTSSDTLSRRTSTSSVRRSTYSTSNSLFTEDPIDGYYTTDTSTISSTTSSSRESLLMMAQDERDFQLEHHRRKYEAKLRRLSRRLSQAPLTFTKAETTLGRKVIQLWKKKRHVAMAQVMFSNIENLNQANKMAAKAGKGVSYQFTVVHDNASAYSLSYWDTNNPSHNAQRATDLALLKESKPCVGIKVIDKKHQSTYIWSMDKFLSRQRHLKGAYYSTDSKKQMKGEDLYYDTVVPAYSLVGLASVPLKNLATQVPVDSTLSIYCKNTGKFKGTVKVLIAPIARSVRQPYHSDREDEHDIIDDQPSNLLHVGQQLVFEVRVVEITGINPEEFSHVHAQFRLSTFGSNLDRVFASEPYKQKSSDSLFFDYHQTLSMTVTEDMLYIIENKDIAFEIYGKPKPGYLDLLSDSHVAEPSALPPKKTQDIIAQIQVCEITAEGDYKPVPVESNPNNEFTNDIFSLQQGQQRRVALTIQHGSHDQEVRFDKIVNLRIGHVRLMDNKNRVTESPSQMEIPLNLIATTSSSTEISAQGSWDSSLHDTIFLNTITPSTHKVLLNLSWTLRNKSQCDIKFEKEIAVVIKDQSKAASLKKKTKRNSVIMNFFSLKPSNIKSQVTALYMVEHVAEMMGVSQLWKQHQATERLLRSYDEGRQKMQRREEVELVRYRLYLTDQLLNPTLEDGEQKVVKTIQPLGVATPESILNIWMSSKAEPTIPESQPKVSRWVPKVHQVVLTGDGVSKKGFLTRKKRSDGNETEKLWCTLLGNYLFMYEDQHEVTLVDILHIKQTQAEESNTSTSFKIDTLFEPSTLQAQDNAMMREWVSAIQS